MIVVFGSLNLDIVLSASHLPAPGETVVDADCLLVAGGKGANQAAAAARAGDVPVAMYGAVGGDDWAALALDPLAEAGVDIAGVARGRRRTGCAAVMVDAQGENAIVVASGANMEAAADRVPDAALGPDTWLVLQMEVRPAENWALVERAAARGAHAVLNVAPAAPVPARALAALDLLVVNEVEAAAVAESEGLVGADAARTARALAAAHDLTCIITLGAAGAIACGPDGAWRVGAHAVEAVDTTGAGDCFTGVLAAALAAGMEMPAALHRAAVAAALSCTVMGAQSSFPGAAAIDAELGRLAPARPVET